MAKKRVRKNPDYPWIVPDLRPLAVAIGQLKPDPQNARTHDQANVKAIASSLREYGQVKPLVVNRRNGQIVTGNGTLAAAKTLNWSHLAVVWVEQDKSKQHGLSIADNRTAELAEWDDEMLAVLLGQVEEDTPDLYADLLLADLASDHGIDLFAAGGEEEAPEPQIDRAAELQAEWKTELGQVWEIPGKAGSHRLLCGDNTTAEIPAGIESVVTDPPYGVNWNPDHRRFTDTKTQHTPVAGDDKPFDPSRWLGYPHVVLWGANCFSDRLPLGSWLVWDKRFKNGQAFLADAEAAWMKGGYGIYLYSETHQGFVGQEVRGHPTQKSSGVMKWCIEKAGGTGEILDPFLGSGTTMVAAEQLGRICYGIEIEPKYVAVALQRMKDMGLEPRLTG